MAIHCFPHICVREWMARQLSHYAVPFQRKSIELLCKKIWPICNTVECLYNMVQYNVIFQTALQLFTYYLDHSSYSQKTPYISPSRATYGLSIVGIFLENSLHFNSVLWSQSYIFLPCLDLLSSCPSILLWEEKETEGWSSPWWPHEPGKRAQETWQTWTTTESESHGPWQNFCWW